MPAGLPSAANLWKMASEWNNAQKVPLKVNLVEQLVEYFYPKFARDRLKFPDVEDMLGMIQAAAEYEKIRGNARGYKWRHGFLDDAKRQLVKLVGMYLWSFQGPDLFRKIDYLRRMVKRSPDRVVYVTFNYDLLLETALTLENIQFTYSIDRDRPESVVVLKPHGSINWFFPSTSNKQQAWLSSECHHHLGKYYVSDNLFAATNWHSPDFALVAPYPSKQIGPDFLKKIWTSFSSAIHSTPAVKIVGYSMPGADRISRIVVRRAGPGHSTRKSIEIINPDPSMKEHYSEYISEKIKFVQKFCDNYF